MFKNTMDYLSSLSWFTILSIIVFGVSIGYMLFGLLSFAIYWMLIAIFFLGASYRESPKVITKQSAKVPANK